MGEVILTFNQLQRVGKIWKKRLGLQRWRISIGIVRRWELEGNIAKTSYSMERNDASIKLSDPIDYIEYPIPYDMEQTLIHELLHLKFCAIYDPQSEHERRDWESLVEDLSWCLIEAWRQDESD